MMMTSLSKRINMNVANIKTISDFLFYCRVPIFFKSFIRVMKNEDIFFLGQYKEHDFIAEAWIEKTHKDNYSFYATWTFPTKKNRPFIMTFGSFSLFKKGVIQFNDELNCVKSFSLVCRYIRFITKKATAEDKQFYFRSGMNPFLIGTWLDKNAICRRPHYDVNNKSWVYYNYENYLPTQQLHAIVMAGMSIGAIPL